MSAVLIPFPLARRRDLVRRQARWFLQQNQGPAEKNLSHYLKVLRAALLRRGIDPASADREVAALQTAIRCEVWRQVLSPEAG